jgi:amino acid permease
MKKELRTEIEKRILRLKILSIILALIVILILFLNFHFYLNPLKLKMGIYNFAIATIPIFILSFFLIPEINELDNKYSEENKQ